MGDLVRHWRQRRRLSQQALSDQCGVSTRHLSYIETGRARPSATMVGQLSEALSVPLRERRRLFTAAGFVPDTSELPLDAPALVEVNEALEQILAGHEPYPALVIDGGLGPRHRQRGRVPTARGRAHRPARAAGQRRATDLDPRGLAPRIANLGEWRAAIMSRIRHEHDTTGDPRLAALLAEFPVLGPHPTPGIVLTLRLRAGDHALSFLTTTTVFGTPGDVTVAELAIEALYPADAATRELLARD